MVFDEHISANANRILHVHIHKMILIEIDKTTTDGVNHLCNAHNNAHIRFNIITHSLSQLIFQVIAIRMKTSERTISTE